MNVKHYCYLDKCLGPAYAKCGEHKFCVGFEGNKVYCYGSNNRCLWNSQDCTKDEDCKKYNYGSPKYTDGDDVACPNPSNWRADACKCPGTHTGTHKISKFSKII